MSQFLEYPIKSLRLTCIVLGSSYNEEDTNDADHHTQSSVPQSADGNDPLLHPGTQRCQMELRLKPGVAQARRLSGCADRIGTAREPWTG
jgi:hypothetical protein